MRARHRRWRSLAHKKREGFASRIGIGKEERKKKSDEEKTTRLLLLSLFFFTFARTEKKLLLLPRPTSSIGSDGDRIRVRCVLRRQRLCSRERESVSIRSSLGESKVQKRNKNRCHQQSGGKEKKLSIFFFPLIEILLRKILQIKNSCGVHGLEQRELWQTTCRSRDCLSRDHGVANRRSICSSNDVDDVDVDVVNGPTHFCSSTKSPSRRRRRGHDRARVAASSFGVDGCEQPPRYGDR